MKEYLIYPYDCMRMLCLWLVVLFGCLVALLRSLLRLFVRLSLNNGGLLLCIRLGVRCCLSRCKLLMFCRRLRIFCWSYAPLMTLFERQMPQEKLSWYMGKDNVWQSLQQKQFCQYLEDHIRAHFWLEHSHLKLL